MNRLSPTLLLSLSALLALAGGTIPAHAEDWPLFRQNPARTGASTERLPGPVTPLWSVSTGGQWIVSSPAIYKEATYVGVVESLSGPTPEQKGSFVALDAETGRALWRFPVEGFIGPVYSSPAATEEGVFFACRNGYFYSLTHEGELRWKTRTGGLDHSSPLVHEGIIYFTNGYPHEGRALALDSRTGEILWQTDRQLYSDSGNAQFTYTSPALKDGLLFVLGRNGQAVALDAATGELAWKNKVGKGAYMFSPLAVEDRVFFASDQNADSAAALDSATGEPIWSFSYPQVSTDQVISSGAVAQDTLVFSVGTAEQTLHTLDSRTGEPHWSQKIGRAPLLGFTSSPAIVDGQIAVGVTEEDGSGAVLLLRLSDGSEIARFPVPKGIVSSPAISGRRIIVGDMDGNLHAFAAPWDDGDANADGKVNVLDVVNVLRASIGLVELTERQKAAADLAPIDEEGIAGDGKINTLDAVALLRRAVGLKPPAGE